MGSEPELRAVIGIWRQEDEVFFIKRSSEMRNYPDVWTVLSTQYEAEELPDPHRLDAVEKIMERMSEERLNSEPISVQEHITSDDSEQNPINTHVHLDIYRIQLDSKPKLNPEYYVDSEWLTLDEYAERNTSETCGSCMRMYWDHAWMENKVDQPFPAVLASTGSEDQ